MTTPKKNEIILDSEAQEIQKKLIEAASQRKILIYSYLASDNDDHHMNKLSKILAKISGFERNENSPFLCAVVVQKETSFPRAELFADFKVLQKECFKYWREKPE